MSRNIKFHGADDDSIGTNYGAHIMMMGTEADGAAGRFSNIEMYQVGQGNIFGRYPIHFHHAGDLPNSWVDNVAVHHSNSRLVTLHGVRFVKVTNSVGFEIFGHNIFIEDGSETKNTIDGNLIINTRQIWTLTNKDVTAASYWITHPDNTVKNNRAAGGEFYAFWYELMEHPEGPTTDFRICPD